MKKTLTYLAMATGLLMAACAPANATMETREELRCVVIPIPNTNAWQRIDEGCEFALPSAEGGGIIYTSPRPKPRPDNGPSDPPVDEPPVDEPPVDEPPVDEPPVDEPPVDDDEGDGNNGHGNGDDEGDGCRGRDCHDPSNPGKGGGKGGGKGKGKDK